MYEVSKKIILLCIPLLLSAQFIAGILNEALDLTDTNQELFISMSHNIFGVLSIAIVVPILVRSFISWSYRRTFTKKRMVT